MWRLWCLLLALGLLGCPAAWAASESVAQGTTITFTDSGGDVTWDVTGLTNGAGRISARHDLGASHPLDYYLSCTFQDASAPTVGAYFEVYLALSAGTHPEGEIGTADAALTTDKRHNLDLVLVVTVDQTSTDTDMTGGAVVQIPTRYVSVGAWNASGQTTEAGAGTSACRLTPITRTIQ